MRVYTGEIIRCSLCDRYIEIGTQYAKLKDIPIQATVGGYTLMICKLCIDEINKLYNEEPAIRLEDTNGDAEVF